MAGSIFNWRHRRPWRLLGVIVAAVVAVPLLAWLALAASFRPGGAGAYQDEPPADLGGERALVTLRVAVWGAGGPALGRFTDMRMQVRRAGAEDAQWRDLLPEHEPDVVAGSDGRQLIYRFAVLSAGTGGLANPGVDFE